MPKPTMIGESSLAVRLQPERVQTAEGEAVLQRLTEAIPETPGWDNQQALAQMREWSLLSTLEQGTTAPDTRRLVALHVLLQTLAGNSLVEFGSSPQDPVLTAAPMAPGFVANLVPIPADARLRLSRFACIRRGDGERLILETPRGLARMTLHGGTAASVLFALSEPCSLSRLEQAAGARKSESRAEVAAMVELLAMAAAVEVFDQGGAPLEEMEPALRQWEFHDLLFHARSRQGRHDYPMGGLFRFKDEIEPRPALKPNPWAANAVPLPRPDLNRAVHEGPRFGAVVESRRSVRNQGAIPLDIGQLGAFLFRTARVRHVAQTPIGQFSSRPYPSGGASYELELYLTVDRCTGLAPGFYYYDPLQHTLCLVSGPNQDTEMLLFEAYQSSAQSCRTQILITIASRFQRVAWKYSGIAYATQLKNVGALYATMYLVATALDLAPCALGLGNSERFCRLAGTSPFEEASIGEFMLGSAPWPSQAGMP